MSLIEIYKNILIDKTNKKNLWLEEYLMFYNSNHEKQQTKRDQDVL